ncbi:hypothetical protein GCM10022212_17250 [Actimicrobium antarcticum]|uniref:Uncharacterized protein n=1 Tax=Actimicrobium antarcticum TaxID=1051899 RepID=A0ABP7T4I6_9BURK
MISVLNRLDNFLPYAMNQLSKYFVERVARMNNTTKSSGLFMYFISASPLPSHECASIGWITYKENEIPAR